MSAFIDAWHQDPLRKGKYFYAVVQPPIAWGGKPARHLAVDSRRVAVLRTRLRFNVARTGDVQFARHLASDDSCPLCGAGDSREHLLLQCPVFDAERYELSALCSEYDVHLTVPAVLGEPLPRIGFRRAFLRATTRFLETVLARRGPI